MDKAYYKTPIGYAEITANERAVLSVNLVAQPAKRQKKMMYSRVPAPGVCSANFDSRHTRSCSCVVLQKCINELDEYFNGTRKHFSVKLEKHGTDFQKKVWDALETIPFGKTVSYEDIAIQIGNKKAVRAVGLANSKNPHWIIVPCHRVIGKNKKLVGYAGGLDRKEWLLKHEKSV